MWSKRTVHLLGGGPSLRLINWNEVDVKGKCFIGINNSYGDPVYDEQGRLVRYVGRDWVQVLWFGDTCWYDWHRLWLRTFNGLRCHCVDRLADKPGFLYLQRGRVMEGLETTDGRVAWNRNSGASAINLAYHLGAARVVLYGFDMRDVDGCSHWHNDHQSKRSSPHARFLRCFPAIKRDAIRLGMEIVNATPGSAIQEFPFVEPMEALQW